MTKYLESAEQVAIGSGRKRHPKGWSPERRARQAALTRGWQPWRRSTGPKSEAGKARCSMNALKHGRRGRAYLHDASRVRYVLRLSALNNGFSALDSDAGRAIRTSSPPMGCCCPRRRTASRQFRESTAQKKLRNRSTRLIANGKYPMRPIFLREGRGTLADGSGGSAPTSMVAPNEALSSEAPKE